MMRTTRLWVMGALLVALACAAGAQTRVRDTLFTAAGNRAEGSCVVQWPSFTTAQAVAVPAGSRLVVIRSGLLDVTLQPSVGATPAGSLYQARCSFAGSVPGPWEQWDVPYSATPVTLDQVRVNPTAPPSPGLIISSVAGLEAALAARPVRAPEWATGRTARITASGELAAVSGASGNCVRVDGTSAPCAEGEGGAASWGNIAGVLSEQTDLQTALDGKAATGHGHAIADVSGLQDALNGKAASNHGHAVADVTGLQDALNAKASTTELTDGLAAKANATHGHAVADVSGLQDALNAKLEQGPGWTPSRAARIDASGNLTAVTGSSTNCVRVDGSSAPCAEGGGGGSVVRWLVGETALTGPDVAVSVGDQLTVIATQDPDTEELLSVQLGVNTATMLSKATAQAGTPWLCETSGSSSSAYQCQPLPIISTLTRGMVLHFVPDVAPASGPITVQIWDLDPSPLKHSDGVTDPGVSAWTAGQMLPIWYDGTVFRLPPAGGGGGGGGEAIWGGITGTLANQTDLQAALDAKAATAHGHAIGDVTGLQDALNARPQQGAGYEPSRAARIDAGGNLTAVTGTATDCVRVDGSSAPCGASGGGTGPGWYQAPLTFPAIPDGSCVAQTFTAVGVAAGATIAFSPPLSLDPNFTHSANAPAADTIRVQLCNSSGGSLTPTAGLTYTARDLTPLGWLRGQAALSFAPVPDGSCSAEQTFTLAPVATTDMVVAGWPDLPPDVLPRMRISGTDTIAVAVCNHTGSEQSLSELTYRATVIK